MRLKTLEIKGFKSFADETVIHFGEDVIGIVGPNGSGKSNIVDAIRWVLGEQSSKELRLDQMSNVIFNGTKKRRAAPLAQVALTFENTKNVLSTDFSSVTIARYLYQSGESEYRLNNVPCRLKDITSLFLDTGIGSDSYAIIALGMVDEILNDKENSRLRMLEQAAGVSKYKIRKRETLSKLKSTEADLERVDDLLFEIENNLKTLEQQAKKTKRYFEIKDEYKAFSLQLAELKLAVLKEKHHLIKEQLTREEDVYRQVEVEILKLETALEGEKKANLDKEIALTERQKELNQLVGDLRTAENERNMLRQRLEFAEQNKRKLGAQIEDNGLKIKELEEQVETYRAEVNLEKRVEYDFEMQLKSAEENLQATRTGHGSVKADLDEILKAQQGFERELFELEKQKAINANRVETLKMETGILETTVFQRKLEFEAGEEKIADIEKRISGKRGEVEVAEKAAEKRKSDIQNLETKSEEIHRKMVQLTRELDAKKNEFKLTQSMVESYEGFPESIKFLSGNKDWSKAAPLLSDLIYVKEEYRVAIENYLEPYLNHYVVQSFDDAYKAIRLLNQSQKGKANFFILDAFAAWQPPLAMTPGAMNAIELVEADPIYRNLLNYLLADVLLSKDDDPSHVPAEEGIVVLSKSGHFIKKRFSVSGGSVGLFEGKKIGRKKNLEILDSAIKRLEKEAEEWAGQYAEMKGRLEEWKAVNDDRKISHLKDELNHIVQEKLSAQARLDNLNHLLAEAADKQNRISEEVGKIEKINEEIEFQLNDKTQHVLQLKAKIADVDSSFREMADQLSRASTDFNEKNIALIRQQNKVTALQRELSFRERQLDELKAALALSQKQLAETADELQLDGDALVKLEGDLTSAYEAKKEKETLLTEAEQVYFSARGGINEIEENLRKLNKNRNDAQVLINTLKDKISDVRLELASLAERVRVEFSININDLKDSKVTAEDETELQLKVERLKNRLDNYGEINPMAVEAYDAMKERHETIVQQRDDILKAKSDLLETIKEIDTTATAQFLESFQNVRTYFIEVFRSLFTEDDAADLILLDPENPLESKIEIVAKPKGKRPQTINQLSGGEKTLTATALLFALYLLKPAPFCIFDEVDAPLDDINIEKFNRIIKKFSKDSQFIIVTHNKLTMAAVDIIYGVYMQEQGVSAVSPVDFRNYKHQAVLEAAN